MSPRLACVTGAECRADKVRARQPAGWYVAEALERGTERPLVLAVLDGPYRLRVVAECVRASRVEGVA